MAWIASLASFALTIYLLFEGAEKRNLTYKINPARVAIVKQGRTSKLSVNFAGREVKTDITAARIVFWNQGKTPIKRNEILSPVIVKIANGAPILEALVVGITRDVIHPIVDETDITKGKIGVSWDILEHRDGFALQVLYSGPSSVPMFVDGAVEGVRHVSPPSIFRRETITPMLFLNGLAVLIWLVVIRSASRVPEKKGVWYVVATAGIIVVGSTTAANVALVGRALEAPAEMTDTAWMKDAYGELSRILPQ